jgi:hypothetical protein
VDAAQARSAVDCFERAKVAGALDFKSSGQFEGWQWWQGADRVVWRPTDGRTVYKIDKDPSGLANWREHERMSKWRDQGHPWAPPTELFTIDGASVLAMPYYPHPIEHDIEIPPSALQARIPDTFSTNFRKDDNGQVMVIDAS